MRKLHVVGFTTDLDGLIFSTRKGSKSGSFVVSITDELLEKLAEADRLRNGDDPAAAARPAAGERSGRREEREAARGRTQSELTPREIQARLRAGRTIDEVAKEARCTREWVERFATPILAEQAQVVELARGFTYNKARLGESKLPLGESVAVNLVDKGVLLAHDEFDQAWSAFQLHDGVWLVRVQYRSRGRVHQASWEVDLASGRLISRDRLASDLGYVDTVRSRRAVEVAVEGTSDDALEPVGDRSRSRAPRRPPAKRARKSGTVSVRAPAKRTTARKVSATKRPVRGTKTTAAQRARVPAGSGPVPGIPVTRTPRKAAPAKATGAAKRAPRKAVGVAKTRKAAAKAAPPTGKRAVGSATRSARRGGAAKVASAPTARPRRAETAKVAAPAGAADSANAPDGHESAAGGTAGGTPATSTAGSGRRPRAERSAPTRTRPAARKKTTSSEPANEEPRRRGSGGAVLSTQTRPPAPPPVPEPPPPPEGTAEARSRRGARVLASRPDRPRIGTDGTQLAGRSPVREPRSVRPRGGASAPSRPNLRAASGPPDRSGNGARATAPPPLSDRLRRVPPTPATPPRPSPPPSVDFEPEPEVELESEALPAQVRASIFGERPSPSERAGSPRGPVALDAPDDFGDDEDDGADTRSRSGEPDADIDAFVIRPRISAKQASELTFSEERPSWRSRLRKTGPDIGPSSLSVLES